MCRTVSAVDEGLLTNREAASLVVLGVLAVVVLVVAIRKPDVFRSFGRALRASLRWKIVVPVFMHVGCLSVAVWAASRLGLWEWGLWKPTALWLVLGGIGLLFRFKEVIEQPGFGRQVSIRTIALVEIVSFLADLASFPLWLEIPAQACAFIAGVISAVAASSGHLLGAARWANRCLKLYSLLAVGWAIVRVASNWEDLDHALHVREFFVPIWLTPVALVSVYAFAVFCVYQTLFAQMAFSANGRSMFKQRLAVVLRTAGRVGRLRVVTGKGGYRYAHANGFREAWAEVGEVLRQGPE